MLLFDRPRQACAGYNCCTSETAGEWEGRSRRSRRGEAVRRLLAPTPPEGEAEARCSGIQPIFLKLCNAFDSFGIGFGRMVFCFKGGGASETGTSRGEHGTVKQEPS